MPESKKNTEIFSFIDSKKKVSGVFVPPPDKSITHRAVFLSSLSPDPSTIDRPLLSGDCISTINAFKSLGVPIRISKLRVTVLKGKKSVKNGLRELHPSKTVIDCGNSGTTMRILSGILSAQPFDSVLAGDQSLSKRPMKRVIEPLTQMGARVTGANGHYPPLKIYGEPDLKPIFWKSAVASAQVKSAVLFAGLFARGKTTVQEPTRSRDHTERMLEKLGVRVQYKKTGSPSLKNLVSVYGPSHVRGLNIKVPGDFSSASFFIAAALLVPESHLTIKGVNLNPARIGFLNVLKKMGADITVKNLKTIFNEPVGDLEIFTSLLKGVNVDPREIPLMIDEIPILAVVATQSVGRTVISGAEELRVKESDRIAAVSKELYKMGADIKEKRDGLIICGQTPLKGIAVESYDDHRIAMSLAVAALVARGKTLIKNFGCVRISFPDFLTTLDKMGGSKDFYSK